MHTTDKKQQFIQLRADGQTLGAIAKTLQVSKTTLWRWDQEEEDHIRQLQLVAQEEAEEEWHTYRMDRLCDLQVCSSFLHDAITKEISKRAESMPLKEMFLYQNLLRAEMEHYRVKPLQRPKPDARAHSSKTEQNGTIPFQNGTPLSSDSQDIRSGPHAPAYAPESQSQLPTTLPDTPLPAIPTGKTEQNGTENPENGTAPQATTEQNITPLASNTAETQSPLPMPSPNMPLQSTTGSEMEQNGTISVQNGTPLSSDSPDAQPHLSMPLPSNPQSKTEQNGTENPENGTSASPGPESEISNSESVNLFGGVTEQNGLPSLALAAEGTIPAENRTTPQP